MARPELGGDRKAIRAECHGGGRFAHPAEAADRIAVAGQPDHREAERRQGDSVGDEADEPTAVTAPDQPDDERKHCDGNAPQAILTGDATPPDEGSYRILYHRFGEGDAVGRSGLRALDLADVVELSAASRVLASCAEPRSPPMTCSGPVVRLPSDASEGYALPHIETPHAARRPTSVHPEETGCPCLSTAAEIGLPVPVLHAPLASW